MSQQTQWIHSTSWDEDTKQGEYQSSLQHINVNTLAVLEDIAERTKKGPRASRKKGTESKQMRCVSYLRGIVLLLLLLLVRKMIILLGDCFVVASELVGRQHLEHSHIATVLSHDKHLMKSNDLEYFCDGDVTQGGERHAVDTQQHIANMKLSASVEM